MICPTLAVQMNGFGLSFQARMNSLIACFRSGTLTKLPRRIAFSVNSLNQRSTKFGQLDNPTTSVSFSRNFASRDSLNVPVRCGLILSS
jgi:hypothetical protein